MKKILAIIALTFVFAACNNEGDRDREGEVSIDSNNTMDQNRANDTRTFNPADTGHTVDSMTNMQDTMRR